MTLTADQLIDRLDRQPLAKDHHHPIASELLATIQPSDPLVLDAMDRYWSDPDALIGDRALLDRLHVEAGNPDRASANLHQLARALLAEPSPVEDSLAEHDFFWSQKCGLRLADAAAIIARHPDMD